MSHPWTAANERIWTASLLRHMVRGFQGAALALILLLAAACGSQTGQPPPNEAVEQALYAKEKREPAIGAEVPRRGKLRRIRCQAVGSLPGVGQAFFCHVDYRFVSTTTCAAFDRARLVKCLGAPSCTQLHRPARGLIETIRFRHPDFGWRLDYPARLYFFSCRHFYPLLTYFQIVVSNFDTRAGRLLGAGSDAFPEGGVALRVFATLGGPRRDDVTDTSFPLTPETFTPEPPFASAETVLGHSFAIDNQRFSLHMYFDSRAPRWDREAIEQAVRSIRGPAA